MFILIFEILHNFFGRSSGTGLVLTLKSFNVDANFEIFPTADFVLHKNSKIKSSQSRNTFSSEIFFLN